jgi:hypothetical protein
MDGVPIVFMENSPLHLVKHGERKLRPQLQPMLVSLPRRNADCGAGFELFSRAWLVSVLTTP